MHRYNDNLTVLFLAMLHDIALVHTDWNFSRLKPVCFDYKEIKIILRPAHLHLCHYKPK